MGSPISGIAHSYSAETLTGKSEQRDEKMKLWFTIENLDDRTHIISEYRHWEETHCYLIESDESTLLIDTGLGICDISSEVKKLTNKPVKAVATHIHRDHIGGHKYYPDFYAHEAELK